MNDFTASFYRQRIFKEKSEIVQDAMNKSTTHEKPSKYVKQLNVKSDQAQHDFDHNMPQSLKSLETINMSSTN